MAKTVIGIFNTRDDAESALSELDMAGYRAKDISIMMQDTGVAESGESGSDVAGGAVTGATTGAVLGGLAGLLVGVGTLAIPGIGGLLIGGPLAAALGLTGAAATTVSGAATGALAGGVLGALMGLGVPEEEARVYEQRLREGAILLAVPAATGMEDDVRDILSENNATDINAVTVPSDYIREGGMTERVDTDYPSMRGSSYAGMGMKGGRQRRTLNRSRTRRG